MEQSRIVMSGGEPSPGWVRSEAFGWRVLSAGALRGGPALRAVLEAASRGGLDAAARALAEVNGHFGLVAASGGIVLAAADAVRSFPVFHTRGGVPRFAVEPWPLVEDAATAPRDEAAVLEFAMSGYASGDSTVFADVAQVRPGEALMAGAHGGLESRRWFVFTPQSLLDEPEERLLARVGEATDAIFARLVREVGDRPVLVPLSGGLDSRLVAAKLVEHGCARVETFSYGPEGNGEADIARRVAERLGLPWRLFPSTRPSARRLFDAADRRRYWAFGSGGCSLPNMQEYQVLSEMFEKGLLAPDAVVVNGQSGDYITGGHIPKRLLDPDAGWDDCFAALWDKHFSLWSQLRTPANRELIEARVRAVLADLGMDDPGGAPHGWAYAADAWEWAERQSKFVVNQQRTYDHFGLDWRLPLWDREYLLLWRDVPAPHMYGQGLYKRWLRHWDYRGLFNDQSLNAPIVRWPGAWRHARWLARAAGLVGGNAAKDAVYARLKYFGHYSNYFGCYSYPHYLRRAKFVRSPASLYVETWLAEFLPGGGPVAESLAGGA